MTQATMPDNFGLPDNDAGIRSRERKRFSAALFASGFFHALLLLLLLGLWRPTPPEEVPLPPIPVTLAQLEGQSGAAGNGPGDTAASSTSNEARAASSQLETATRNPTPPPTPKQQAVPPPALPMTQTPVATPVPPRKPAPPQKTAQAQTKPIETPPTPPQPPQPTTTQAAEAPSSASSVPASTDSILREGVGGRGRGDQGTGLAAVGNGSAAGTADDYLIRVQRWISRFRKYPDSALKQKEEGKGVVGFTIARDGTVLDVWIDTSTGFPDLDAATLQMVRDASPVPPIPAIYPGDKRTLDLPVNFEIGIFDRLFK